MKILKFSLLLLLVALFTISCEDRNQNENEDTDDGSSNSVTFLGETKSVIGGCTVQTTDPDLGILCTFNIFYQLEDSDVTISATVSGPCEQELNDTFIMSDSFFEDEIRFGATVIYFDATDPDVYYGDSGTITLINNATETSMTFNGEVYNIASSVIKTINGDATCPL